MSENKIRISVTIDRELKEKLEDKLDSTGGKISTLFSRLGKDFLADGRGKYPIWNPNKGYDDNQKAQLFIEISSVLKIRELTNLTTTKIWKIKTHEKSVDMFDSDRIEQLARLYETEIEG